MVDVPKNQTKPNQFVGTQSSGFKYSHLIQVIYTQLYGFSYYYVRQNYRVSSNYNYLKNNNLLVHCCMVLSIPIQYK